jgi:hypothetical protein
MQPVGISSARVHPRIAAAVPCKHQA